MTAERWEGPAAPIWAHVCGLPKEKRRKRPLLVLRAFIDDSGTGGKKAAPVFVLAGYIATIEKWAVFSEDWKPLLDRYGLTRFKMSEANSRWLSRGEIEPVEQFYRVIERHVSAEARIVVPYKAYDSALARLPFCFEERASIYLLAFTHLFNFIAMNRRNLGVSGRVDLIFDKGTFPKDLIDRDWELLLSVVSDDAKEMLGNPPMFRSDDEELPLQAADFLAWWVLKGWRDEPSAPPNWRYPWKKKRRFPGFEASWDEDSLYEFLHKIGANVLGTESSKNEL